MKGPAPRPTAERLRERLVASTDGCVVWAGPVARNGYARMLVGSTLDGTRQNRMVHRIAWELGRGPIPEGMYVCHSCDNRICCNVDHLFLGTHADNMRDMTSKGRQNRGERNGNARLDAEKVATIRRLEQAGQLDYHATAAQFGVTRKHLMSVAQGNGWKHVTELDNQEIAS